MMKPTPARIASSISAVVFSHAGEDNASGSNPRSARAAARRPTRCRHRPQLLEDPQHAEVAVGFDGVADAMAIPWSAS